MDIGIALAVTAPVVVGLVEVVKRATGLEERFAPLVSIGIGIAVTFLASGSGMVVPALTSAQAVFYGLVAGLTASGLYSGSKALSGN